MPYGLEIDTNNGIGAVGGLTTFRQIAQGSVTVSNGSSNIQQGTLNLTTFTRSDLVSGNYVLIAQATQQSGTASELYMDCRVGNDFSADITTVATVPTSVQISYRFRTDSHSGYVARIDVFAMEF